MTDIITSKFENPIIIAADHPKMKLFYNLNKKIALAYLQRFIRSKNFMKNINNYVNQYSQNGTCYIESNSSPFTLNI